MKNHLTAIALIICFSSSLYGQTEDSPWLIGVGFNSVNADGSESTNYKLPSLSLSRYIFENFSIGLNYSENDIIVSNQELYYYSIDGIIKYNIPNESKILGVDADPYLYAGYGLSNYGEGEVSMGSLNTSYGPSFGAGINFQLSKNIALNTGVSYKSLDEKNAYSNLQHVVGIKFNFGKGDSDGDGVPDKKDHCPDLPGLIELNGCPDSDGDGITDEEDKCPNIPGLISMNGCADSDGDGFPDPNDPCPKMAGVDGRPCPDSDGDGITDELDSCPNDIGSKSNGGCKLPDLDNDGVPNTIDKCPNESGSEKFGGCPNLPKSISSYLDNYGEIFFEFDSFNLNSKQKLDLSNLGKLLKRYGYIKLYIDGHSSNEGDSSYNLFLSNKRSNNVKEELISEGIGDKRLDTRSFGEDNPNYANDPVSERRKNRRVILSINKDL